MWLLLTANTICNTELTFYRFGNANRMAIYSTIYSTILLNNSKLGTAVFIKELVIMKRGTGRQPDDSPRIKYSVLM